MLLKIRKAVKEDVNKLCYLIEHLTGHPITHEQVEDRLFFIENSPFDYMYVCTNDEMVVGLLGFRIRTNVEEISRFGEISAIVVDPNERGQGIGKFMFKYAEKLSKDLGCIGVWVVSGFGREEEAHEFYKRMGFRVTGYRFVNFFDEKNI